MDLLTQTKNLILLAFIVLGIVFFVLVAFSFINDYSNKILTSNEIKSDNSINQTISNQNSNLNISNSMIKIRKPVVAGSFYPAELSQLKNKVSNFLKNVSQEIPASRMVLVPHAGYDYSGQVAAYGFKSLQNYAKLFSMEKPTVIILGMSHQIHLNGFAVDSNDKWEIPLGSVELDKEMIDRLSHEAVFSLSEEAFLEEHSLEVEIPFLKETLGDFKIVPILVGDVRNEDLEKFAISLKKVMGENSLIVISSDLSHYPSYQDAKKADEETINAILSGKVEVFDNMIEKEAEKKIQNAVTFACAENAVKLGIYLRNELGLEKGELFQSANSGDVTKDTVRVVGYASLGFWGKKKPAKEDAKKELIKMAKETVENYVKEGKTPDFSGLLKMSQFSFLSQKAGVFVTISKNGNLRGCIGLMESDKPLYETVPQMAVAAAAYDSRFSPVSEEELSDLEYEVSVLTPMKKVNSIREIKLGVHGVKVKNGTKEGVFLPQVATETKWNLDEFLTHLCVDKAGLSADCIKDSKTNIYVFEAEVISL